MQTLSKRHLYVEGTSGAEIYYPHQDHLGSINVIQYHRSRALVRKTS